MENVENKSLTKEEQGIKKLIIKSKQGFNESNLMTLPIFSLKRKKVDTIERVWYRDKKEIGLIVEGSGKRGCPTIYELDVLMALFKLLAKSMDNVIELSEDRKILNMPRVINFTYRKLAKEMRLKGFGAKTKKRLEDSIKCLTEATIYSNLAFRNQEIGEYVADFKGEESCRILKNYKSYSLSKRKKLGQELLSAKDIEEFQSVEIDEFFFNNMCNNFFKLYDYDKYMLLTKGIAKKLLLILTQWSHGSTKFVTMQRLYDYIGLDVNTTQDEYYYNQKIKEALEELVKVKFIQSYEFKHKEGITFIFNTTLLEKEKGLNKYTSDLDIVVRLREIGIEYEDISKYCNSDTLGYISGLLRYVDYRHKKGWVDDIKTYTYKGLPYDSYDVSEFILEN